MKALWVFIPYLLFLLTSSAVQAQELQPRRWGHLPVNTHFLGVGYAYTDGDISFDPALQLKDVKLDLHSFAVRYIYAFELLNKTARIELAPIFQKATWKGLLREEPRSTSREGLADPIVRFAINLMGAPPLEKKEYIKYRGALDTETSIGAGLIVQLPFGEYDEDKLLNLGSNRFIFRPQLGIVRAWDQWSLELTGSTWLYTDNDDFYNSTELEQDPFYTVQSQLVYDLSPGIWFAASTGYGTGSETKINGVHNDDTKKNIAWALSLGLPITKSIVAKIFYVGNKTQSSTGFDSNTISFAIAQNF